MFVPGTETDPSSGNARHQASWGVSIIGTEMDGKLG
jgi:hypothetical protein